MKKYGKMLTVLFLSATLTTGMSTISHAKEIDANELTFEEKASLAQYDETFLARQSESAEDYQVLQDMISAASYSKSNNSLTENYGGAYIDGSGSLVVYLKETDDNSMRQLDEIDNDIIVKPCQYTLDDLTNIMDQINAYKLSGTREFADEFNYYALSDSENKIIVELEELTDENMEKFKKEVCDSEAITFEQATDDPVDEANINAGSKITSGSSAASVGYRSKRNGVNGIVTASHFVKSGATVKANGSTIGTCTASVYSGSVDAAFLKITSGTPTNTSGGLVYSHNTSTGLRYTLGIHKGTKGGVAQYVKANQINRSLGTSRY